jgi:hypothetical protein
MCDGMCTKCPIAGIAVRKLLAYLQVYSRKTVRPATEKSAAVCQSLAKTPTKKKNMKKHEIIITKRNETKRNDIVDGGGKENRSPF